MDVDAGVMKKCTLCVDRIYNENIPEVDREPACVRACPTNARHFGDFADPNSEVSRLTKTRGGFELMPEQGTKPINRYLPPRLKQKDEINSLPDILTPMINKVPTDLKGFLGWVDKTLDKL
jgi:Fe-S-cluster-containing dehydrogenase component